LPPNAVHACTDITGFGLAGHGTEMARASGVTLEIGFEKLPFFDGVVEIAANNRPGGLLTNQEHFSHGVNGKMPANDYLIYDPQTSGGLLVAVSEDSAQIAEAALQADGRSVWRIGRAIPAVPGTHVHMV
ncbi:MAG TPA: AIR synthase-related protein, partial [Vicinamibacterales bacterium]